MFCKSNLAKINFVRVWPFSLSLLIGVREQESSTVRPGVTKSTHFISNEFEPHFEFSAHPVQSEAAPLLTHSLDLPPANASQVLLGLLDVNVACSALHLARLCTWQSCHSLDSSGSVMKKRFSLWP